MRAGLLGIGGGMIVNPLLLEFGTHPHVAAATSTLMVSPLPPAVIHAFPLIRTAHELLNSPLIQGSKNESSRASITLQHQAHVQTCASHR